VTTAPTNTAFNSLPVHTLEYLLLPENVDSLRDMVLYHVLHGSYPSSELPSKQMPTLKTNADGLADFIVINAMSAGGIITLDGRAHVVLSDVFGACNGVIHAINAILLPNDSAALVEDDASAIATGDNSLVAGLVDNFFDWSQQPLPLLEATLVQDVPQEPVYDAIPVRDTQDNNVHGWLRISLKLRAVILESVLVATAAIIAVVVIIVGSPKELSSQPITTSTNSTTAPVTGTGNETGTELNTVSETLTACLFLFNGGKRRLTSSSFDANICLSVRADRRALELGATGSDYRWRWCS
jgi:hypothetical protein